MYILWISGEDQLDGIELELLTQPVGHLLGPAVWYKLFVATCQPYYFPFSYPFGEH